MEADCHNLAQALSDHYCLIADALTGSLPAVDRYWLAHILLCRLLLTYDLQVAGFLADGDRWYLHTHLSQHSQTANGSFFKHFLQPLWHQGFGLPASERPRSLQTHLGKIPYLGPHPFQAHSLEQQYPEIDLPDEAIEKLLGWLAEQSWARTLQADHPTSITRTALADAYAQMLAKQTGKNIPTTTPEALAKVREKTIDRHILGALGAREHPTISLDNLLADLDDETCRILTSEILPRVAILDPICQSGRLLVMALYRLQKIYQCCWQYAQNSTDPDLHRWVQSLQDGKALPLWTLTSNVLTQNLHGVDVSPAAITVTQTQLWLGLLTTAKTTADLLPLPDLDFNLTTGNALIGFVRVDEKSFDRILPKKTRQAASAETVLQGNLLQPLAAASYRDTLVEKKIRVEHYQTQTRAMGVEGGIPEYVQTEFLRDRIDEINQAAQQKLNRLLFETLSRNLGIKINEPQLSGRTRKRLLTLADVEALQPFHWGFVFNTVFEQGGFDVIMTQRTGETLRPNADEFYRQHQDSFRQHHIELAQFRRSRRPLLKQFPDLAQYWSLYAGRIACLRDYVRRSEDYQLPLTASTRAIAIDALLAQRCRALAKAGGVVPHLYPSI